MRASRGRFRLERFGLLCVYFIFHMYVASLSLAPSITQKVGPESVRAMVEKEENDKGNDPEEGKKDDES